MKISKAHFWGSIIFTLMMILFLFLGNEIYIDKKAAQDEVSLRLAYEKKIKLQELLMESFAATSELSYKIIDDGGVKNFEKKASQLLSQYSHIDILQLSPDAIVQYSYPLKGNEAVIGLNLLADSVQKTEALKSIQKKRLHFVGPFNLKQGGLGVAARQPIYRNDRFWGFAAAIIKLSTLLTFSGLNSNGSNGYDFQLTQINPITNEKEFFLPLTKSKETGESVEVIIPEGKWELTAIPLKHINYILVLLPFVLIGLVFSFLGAYFVYNSINRKKIADTIIKVQKNELNKVFDRITDGYVALDKNWNYVVVNKRAAELLGTKAKGIIGKNIWTEFPELVGEPLYNAMQHAMETQQPVNLQLYFPPLDQWHEDFIYPSPDGVSVYYRDITDQKKAELEVLKSEKKYRSLVEQASVGILVYTLDGTIYEFNPIAHEFTGYTKEEFNELKLQDLLIDEVVMNEEIGKRLMTGEPVFTEKKIRHKDGSGIEVEVNARLLPDGKILGVINDITERIKTNTQLKESEKKFHTLFEQASDAIIIYSFEGKILDCNEHANKILGYTKEELLNLTLLDIAFKEDLLKIPIRYDDLKNGINVVQERRIKTKDGFAVQMEVNSKMMSDGKIMVIARDITERKKAEQEKSRLLDTLQKSLNEIYIFSRDTLLFQYVNEGALKNLGYSELEIVRFTALDIKPDLTKESFGELVLPLINGKKEKIVFYTNHQRKDGSLYPVEVHLQLIKQGEEIVFLAVILDITERKKADFEKKQLFSLIETSQELIAIGTLDGMATFINKAGKKLLGIDADADLSYFHFSDFFHPDEVEKIAKEYTPSFIEKGGWEGDSYIQNIKTKSKIPVYMSAYVIRDSVTGKAMGLGNVCIDITERKKSEEELTLLTKQLRTLTSHMEDVREEERKTIAREIHDELGQQLTGLKMDVAMLSKKINSQDESILFRIEDIQNLTDEMVSSVKRILDNLRPGILDHFGIIAAIETYAQEFEKRHNIKTTFISSHDDLKLAPELSTELYRIFQESLTNVAKHSKAKTVIATFDANENGYVLAIEDNGNGFDLSKEKDPRSYGLIGMKERAFKINADFELISIPGKGTTIIISIKNKDSLLV